MQRDTLKPTIDYPALKAAVLELGGDPAALPPLERLLAPRLETPSPAPREPEYRELTDSEWTAIQRALQTAMPRYQGLVGPAQRRTWNGFLLKVGSGSPWSRVPARFAKTADTVRKAAERLATSGLAERVVVALRGDPAISGERAKELERLAEFARQWRERVTEFRSVTGRPSRPGVGRGPR